MGPLSVPLEILRLSIKETFVLELPKKSKGEKHFSNLIMKKNPIILETAPFNREYKITENGEYNTG